MTHFARCRSICAHARCPRSTWQLIAAVCIPWHVLQARFSLYMRLTVLSLLLTCLSLLSVQHRCEACMWYLFLALLHVVACAAARNLAIRAPVASCAHVVWTGVRALRDNSCACAVTECLDRSTCRFVVACALQIASAEAYSLARGAIVISNADGLRLRPLTVSRHHCFKESI